MAHFYAQWATPRLLILLALAALPEPLIAQAPSVQSAFDVAAVKPNVSGLQQMTIAAPPSGVIRATNVNVRVLIRYAYDVPDSLIFGLANGSDMDRFDIAAKAPPNIPLETVRAMFRALLADRFGLKVHSESRPLPMDVLTKVTDKVGPKVKATERPCQPPTRCGVHTSVFGTIEAHDGTFLQLAAELTSLARHSVVDHTSDQGHYDFTLTYTPDAITLRPEVRAQFPTVDADGPVLSTALREQLGIRLQATTGPVDVLVVDHIVKPSLEN